jgi:uncharacterized protein with beta-barrel porin domain
VAAAYAPLLTETSHLYEYVEVPVEGIIPLTVRGWSASSAVALTVGAAGAVSAVFTVTRSVAEDWESGVAAESVTL